MRAEFSGWLGSNCSEWYISTGTLPVRVAAGADVWDDDAWETDGDTGPEATAGREDPPDGRAPREQPAAPASSTAASSAAARRRIFRFFTDGLRKHPARHKRGGAVTDDDQPMFSGRSVFPAGTPASK